MLFVIHIFSMILKPRMPWLLIQASHLVWIHHLLLSTHCFAAVAKVLEVVKELGLHVHHIYCMSLLCLLVSRILHSSRHTWSPRSFWLYWKISRIPWMCCNDPSSWKDNYSNYKWRSFTYYGACRYVSSVTSRLYFIISVLQAVYVIFLRLEIIMMVMKLLLDHRKVK